MHPKLKNKPNTTAGELKSLYHVGQPTIIEALADLEPVMQMPYSRGTMRVYDSAQACALIEACIERKRRQPAPVAAPAPQVVQPTPVVDLGPLTNRVLAVENQMEALVEQMTEVTSQNTLIFKAVGDLRVELLARLDALHAAVDNPPIVVDNPPPPVVVDSHQPRLTPTPVKVAPPLRVVGIVGLLGGQREMIKQEFGDLFNLRFYESDDAKTKMFRDSVRGCEVVLAMKNFINHSVDRIVLQEGVKLELINGGVTSLRNRLTAMYVNDSAEATV